jgi:heavy metal sensor kinase
VTAGPAPRADAPAPPAGTRGLRQLLPGRRTLRLRLTLWYVAVLALSTGIIAVLFFVGLETALMDQLDSGIRETAVTEAKTSVGDFLPAGEEPAPQDAASESMIRVLAADGAILGGAGAFRLPDAGGRPGTGFATVAAPGAAAWRVYTQAVKLPTGEPAWLQTGRSLAATEAALSRLRRALLLGLPLMLVLAAAGGLFLAGRALAPIDHMAASAERITGSDLSGRMGAQGSEELGRLAAAFDRMLERLEEAFRRERRFVSDVSHELRTPLTALRGRIEVTLTRPRSRPEYEDTLRALQTEVERLTRLSEDLLLLARFDRGALKPRTERVDLSGLLTAVAGQVRPLAEARGQRLEDRVEPGLVVPGDPDQLIRLFFNLLDNAVKFTGDGGRIGVAARREAAAVTVAVSDTGAGIAPEHVDRVFDRFYRAEESRARATGGHGLGLAIAGEIARAHGGTLSASSRLGQGSTFTVTLPTEAEAQP